MTSATYRPQFNLLHVLVFIVAAAAWAVVLLELAKVSLR